MQARRRSHSSEGNAEAVVADVGIAGAAEVHVADVAGLGDVVGLEEVVGLEHGAGDVAVGGKGAPAVAVGVGPEDEEPGADTMDTVGLELRVVPSPLSRSLNRTLGNL